MIDDLSFEPHRQEALFGGEGSVFVWDLLGSKKAAPFGAVLACELEAGGRVGRHVQEHMPEIVIGLSGDGVAIVDGDAQELGPGAVVHLPLGSVLAIENVSPEMPLRYLIIKAR